VQRKCRYTKTL